MHSSNTLQMPRSISIVTVCMNRREHLLEATPRVARWSQHIEHLIVDWSSEQPLRRDELPDDPRIRLIRVTGEVRWNLCRAYNFGFDHARGDCLFKLDADAWPEAINEVLDPQSDAPLCWFGSGDSGRLGQFLIDRQLLERVGGFNEHLWGYGFDDKDIKARLQSHADATIQFLPPEALGVIVHSIRHRASRVHRHGHQDSPLERAHALSLKRATSLGNRVMAAFCPWSAHRARSRYLHDAQADTWSLEPGTAPAAPSAVEAELVRLRRHHFWGHFLTIPEEVVMVLPVKLLPEEKCGDFCVRWWHRLYWHTLRRLLIAPVALLGSLKGRRAQWQRWIGG